VEEGILQVSSFVMISWVHSRFLFQH
jgi:hypothetical protein